jgi:hypothetical protein
MLNWSPATLLKVLFVAWKLEELIIMKVEIKDDKRPATDVHCCVGDSARYQYQYISIWVGKAYILSSESSFT